jgi:hypothetical protein
LKDIKEQNPRVMKIFLILESKSPTSAVIFFHNSCKEKTSKIIASDAFEN